MINDWKEEKYCTEQGYKMNYVLIENAGKPMLVLLHGLMNDWSSWKGIVNALGNDYSYLLIDLPGYGSSAPIKERNFRKYAEIVNELVGELVKEKKKYIGGLSSGASIAVTALQRDPELYSGAILFSPSTKAPKSRLRKLFKRMSKLHILYGCYRLIVKSQIFNIINWKFSCSEISWIEFRARTLRGAYHVTLPTLFDIIEESYTYDTMVTVRKVLTQHHDKHLIIICGERDNFSACDELLGMQEKYNIHAKIIEGAGHVVTFEKPLEIRLILKELISQ